MSSLHQYHSSDPIQLIPSDSNRKISSTSEQFVILGFVFDTKYVDEALENLKAQCPNGSIDRIDTVFKTKLGFFSWTNQILINGYCMEKGTKK
jgi:hypothetical protein